jgi:hypothetical protein
MLARLAALLLCGLTFPLFAATFTVTNGASTTGPGTLHQAILDANANPGRDQIVFAVPFATTETALPAITDAVDIDGTFGGSDAEVGPLGPVEGSTLFRFSAGSSTSTLRDLEIRWSLPAIRVDTGVTGVVIAGNQITGQVRIAGSNNTFGGTTAADRNSGMFFLTVANGSGNQILRNTLSHITVLDAPNTIVGSVSNGNQVPTITLVDSPGSVIEGNTVGTGGVTVGSDDVIVRNNIIGGTVRVVRDGLLLVSGVAITGNSITSSGLAIDLSANGPTPNDAAPDPDFGDNAWQNFPVLTSASLTPGGLTVTGTLTSAPLTPYQIELFSNDAANPDARTLLDSFTASTDATGNLTFTRTITSPLPVAGEVITSTATNRGLVAIPGSAPNSTSEVSAPIALAFPGGLRFESPTYAVDEDAGTVTITVTRTGGDEGTVTVNYATTNGSATAPVDYTQTSGTLTFGPGVTEQTFTVPIVQDMVPESDETFTITLSGPSGGATLINATTTVTITGSAIGAAAVPTASEWGLMVLALGLALFAARAVRHF